VLFSAVSALTLWPEVPTARIFFLDALAASLTALLLQSFLQTQLWMPLTKFSQFVHAMLQGDPPRLPRTDSFDEINTLGENLRQAADLLFARLQHFTADRSQTDAILSGMMEGVVVLDRQGKIVLINSAFEKMFQNNRIDSVGKYHYEVLRHYQLNRLVEAVRVKQQATSIEIEFDRSHSYFEVHATPTQDASSWMVLVFHNITEVKRLERVRADFIANISHELKTPLSVVKGYLETLSEEWDEDPAKTREYLEILRRQADRMQNIVSDLLQLSRIESGTDPIRKEPIQIKDHIEKIILSLTPMAKKKTIALTFSGKDFCFWADPEKMTRALSNLLDNALKYTPTGGRVEVTASDDAETVMIEIADTGIGIPKVDQTRIFERFYRVDRARSRDLGGTGLGLSIVKHIVEAHEGKISVHSEMGKGTRFAILLPNPSNLHLTKN
jgi:two-component system phosphate regulon sensor histidine kinase PhoR